MNRLRWSLLVVLTALVIMPFGAFAQTHDEPGLVVKTTSIELTLTPIFSSFYRIPVIFGNDGATVLEWDLYTSADFSCAAETTIPWLSLEPKAGSLKPITFTTVNARLNVRYLPQGIHTTTLCLASNDPAHPITAIPVTVRVK
jgi:hypothetical protein